MDMLCFSNPKLRPRVLAVFCLCAWLLPKAEVASAATSADTLSVPQCIALAWTHAPGVMAAAAEYAAARADSTAATFNRRPAFSLLSSATIAPEGYYDPVITNLGEYQLKLGVEWNWLDGGERARERSKAAVAAQTSSAEWAAAAREAGLATATAALDLVRQAAIVDFLEDASSWLDRLSAVIESGIRTGAYRPADAVRAALELDAVRSDLLTARERREELQRELAELIDRAEWAELVVTAPDTTAERSPTTDDSLAVLARAERSPARRSAAAEEALRRLALEDARKSSALHVDLSSDAGLAGADLTKTVPDDLRASNPDATFSDRLRRDLGASASFVAKRPLGVPGQDETILARTAAVEAATVRRRAASVRSSREALDLLGRWRASSLRLASARASVTRASDHVLRLRSLYAGGGTGLLDLLDARRQLDEARQRLADARFEAWLARFEAALP